MPRSFASRAGLAKGLKQIENTEKLGETQSKYNGLVDFLDVITIAQPGGGGNDGICSHSLDPSLCRSPR